MHIKYTALYHPQANPYERINRVLKTMLRSFVSENHRIWDTKLGPIGAAVRGSWHEVTGYSPNFLVFGRELSSPKTITPVGEPITFDRAAATTQERSDALKGLFEDVQGRLKKAYEHNDATSRR